MACGLTPPDAGRVRVGGTALARDDAADKHRIGLVAQDLTPFMDVPAQSNVELFRTLYGLPQDSAKSRASEVLLLDEETAGRRRVNRSFCIPSQSLPSGRPFPWVEAR